MESVGPWVNPCASDSKPYDTATASQGSTSTHAPFVHACVAPHALPHAPQFAGSVRLPAHASSAAASSIAPASVAASAASGTLASASALASLEPVASASSAPASATPTASPP